MPQAHAPPSIPSTVGASGGLGGAAGAGRAAQHRKKTRKKPQAIVGKHGAVLATTGNKRNRRKREKKKKAAKQKLQEEVLASAQLVGLFSDGEQSNSMEDAPSQEAGGSKREREEGPQGGSGEGASPRKKMKKAHAGNMEATPSSPAPRVAPAREFCKMFML